MAQAEFEAPDGYNDAIAESMKSSPEGTAIEQTVAPKNKPSSSRKTLIHYAVLTLVFAVITLLTPVILPNFPLYSVIPAAFLLVYIFLTRRIFESLSLGIVLAFLMAVSSGMYITGDPLYGFDAGETLSFFDAINYSLIKNVANEDTAWLFIVCGLMGSFVAIIEQAGGVYAFGRWVAKRAKTKKSTLLWTWILGLIIFVDDYLNALTVGSSMSPLTDKHKVSREYLAYIVDSTAAPDTTLIPVSTWAVFIAGLYSTTIAEYGLTDTYGGGIRVFISSIPFNFYGWFSLMIVPLTIFGVIPLFGKLKRAEKRAQETGVLAPPGSEKIDIRAGEMIIEKPNARVWNFFIPIIMLIASTLFFGIDLMYGVIFTLAFMFVFYLVQGLIDGDSFFSLALKGFKNMLTPLLMVVLAYMFADGIHALGFMDYVVDVVSNNVPIWALPALIFLVFGATEFIMGLSWGMYAIAIPLVTVLAFTLNIHPSLLIAAVVSAGVWGSHICFYSDATILSSSAAGCDNFEHATSQLPYGLIAATLALIGFVIAGIVMA
jgi:tetracycline resistance efflux pump